jgi:hypothetical protein
LTFKATGLDYIICGVHKTEKKSKYEILQCLEASTKETKSKEVCGNGGGRNPKDCDIPKLKCKKCLP